MFLTSKRATAGAADGEDRSVFGRFWFEPIGMRSSSGIRVDSKQAMRLAAVYSCIRVRAEAFAVLPFELYRRKGGRRRELVTDHWLHKLLARQPNRFQTPFEWKEMMAGHLDLRGNAFNDIVANSRGEITELLPIHPDRVTIQLLDNGNYRYKLRRQDGGEEIRTRGEIWHIRGLSSDGIVGLNPIELARDVIGLGLSAQTFGNKFFANDARPGGWIEQPPAVKFKDDEEKKKFSENWQRAYSGANRGKTAILENGMKYHQLELKNSDAQFIETRKHTRSEIAGIFRVPPHKIGDLERSTNNNIEHQALEFVTDAVAPMAERFESSITTFLLPEDDHDLEVEFNLANLVRGDMAARGNFYNRMFNLGAMSPNDIRVNEGQDEVEGGDQRFVPMNLVPLDQAAQIARSRAKKGGGGAPSNQTERTDARLMALLEANATRMARRIAGGHPPTADVLAEAMAITEPRAQTWLELDKSGYSQDELKASLLEQALQTQKGQP